MSGEINDGTVLYIDPNDPQAAALLQQAGKLLLTCYDVAGIINNSFLIQVFVISKIALAKDPELFCCSLLAESEV